MNGDKHPIESDDEVISKLSTSTIQSDTLSSSLSLHGSFSCDFQRDPTEELRITARLG